MGKIRETRELKQCIEIWEEKDIIIKKPEKKETRKHSWNVNLNNITFLYLYPMTHCRFVSNVIANLSDQNADHRGLRE